MEVPEGESLWVASVSNEGRLLLFPLDQLPEMAKGKGNKDAEFGDFKGSSGSGSSSGGGAAKSR